MRVIKRVPLGAVAKYIEIDPSDATELHKRGYTATLCVGSGTYYVGYNGKYHPIAEEIAEEILYPRPQRFPSRRTK